MSKEEIRKKVLGAAPPFVSMKGGEVLITLLYPAPPLKPTFAIRVSVTEALKIMETNTLETLFSQVSQEVRSRKIAS